MYFLLYACKYRNEQDMDPDLKKCSLSGKGRRNYTHSIEARIEYIDVMVVQSVIST